MAKEKLQVEDRESPDKRPSFYKIIWLANTIDLRIPPAFKHHLLNEETELVTLRTSCGNWDIKLVKNEDEGDIFFKNGWKEFVKHHSLGNKEILIFNYNGDMSFDVVIFDKNSCQNKYPSEGAKSSNQKSPPSSFTSSFPFFKCSMKGYSVGSKSILLIPRAFSSEHLPKIRQNFILRNAKGISWTVSIILTTGKDLAISGGWKAFVDDNLIKKCDVCVFELVEKTTMQVHIFRC